MKSSGFSSIICSLASMARILALVLEGGGTGGVDRAGRRGTLSKRKTDEKMTAAPAEKRFKRGRLSAAGTARSRRECVRGVRTGDAGVCQAQKWSQSGSITSIWLQEGAIWKPGGGKPAARAGSFSAR